MDKLKKNILVRTLYNFIGTLLAYLFVLILKLIFPGDKIVTNIFWGSVGHLTIEFDYLFRKFKINKNSKIIVFASNNKNNFTIKKIFKNKFRIFICNNYLFYFIDKISENYFKDYFEDASLSACISHYSLNKKKYKSLEKMMLAYSNYYKMRKFEGFFDKNIYDTKSIQKFLDLNSVQKKIALIHIKEKVGNAVFETTNPITYVKSLEYLIENDYQLIFSGREKMPDLFKKYNMLNYANWPGATFENDLALVSKSSLVISYASGFANMPDLMNIPNIYLASWHIPLSLYSSNTIFLPSLFNKKNGQELKFFNQINMYLDTNHKFDINKFNDLDCIVPNSDDILDATMFALNKNNKKYSDLETKFKNLVENIPLKKSKCRIPNNFLLKNINRF